MVKTAILPLLLLLSLTTAVYAQPPGSPLWAEQLIIIRDGRGSYGYGNLETGKFAIMPQFESARAFSGGLAAVMMDSMWGFINPEGRMVIKPQFAEVHAFYDGLAAVKLNEDWFFINPQGRVVDDPVNLEGGYAPGMILAEKPLAGVHPGFEKSFGPDDFRHQVVKTPPDPTADHLARAIGQFNEGAEKYHDYEYSGALINFQAALQMFPEYSAGFRLAWTAIDRINLVLAAGIPLELPSTGPAEEQEEAWDEGDEMGWTPVIR